jgi:hypothetical protein
MSRSKDWPEDDRPGTVAYFCGTLNATWPTAEAGAGYARRYEQRVRADAAAYVDRNLKTYFPGAVGEQGFDVAVQEGDHRHHDRQHHDPGRRRDVV